MTTTPTPPNDAPRVSFAAVVGNAIRAVRASCAFDTQHGEPCNSCQRDIAALRQIAKLVERATELHEMWDNPLDTEAAVITLENATDDLIIALAAGFTPTPNTGGPR